MGRDGLEPSLFLVWQIYSLLQSPLCHRPLMVRGGIGPPTHRASTCRSTCLSYRTMLTPAGLEPRITRLKVSYPGHLDEGAMI